MKSSVSIIALVWLLIVAGCTSKEAGQTPETGINVAVFQGHGAAETCVWEAYAACGMDKSLNTTIVNAKDIAAGVLDHVDVLVIPGGGGSREYLNLGASNHQRIRDFVDQGGGYVGICAGAYLASNTPDYSCLHLSGGQAIDIEHDNRGRGIAKVTLNEAGKALFPEVADRDTLFIMYYEGPVIVAPGDTASYTTLGIMESDVHVEGDAPANMTNNRPFFFLNKVGEGKVMSVIGHPEATPGMQWMLPRMVHAVVRADRAAEPQIDEKFVDPTLFGREILMTEERREQESAAFKTFLYGNAAEKVEAIRWLAEVNSWDGKRWLQGLLYDTDEQVRFAATRAIDRSMHRYYIADLEVALGTENSPEVRAAMETALAALR